MNKNVATLSEQKLIEHVECQECFNDYLFKMKDNYHEFYMTLNEVLTCLWLAGKEGALPPLPEDWCYKVVNEYL